MLFEFLLSLSLAGPAAPATSLSQNDFDALVAALLPEIEEATGRPFVQPPRSGIATRKRLRAALSKPPVHIRPADAEPPPSRVPTPHEEALLRRAIAVYVPSLDGVYLIAEAVEETIREVDLAPEALHPLVRCITAHELVHALQAQYGVTQVHDDDSMAGHLALREGHATHVAQRWCAAQEGPVMASVTASLQGTDVAASLAVDDPAAPYAWGAWLAKTLEERDPEAIWAAMTGPPPSWTALTQSAKPSLAPGWADPAPLLGALASLGIPFEELAEAFSPGAFLPAFVGVRPGEQAVPTGLAGLTVTADKGLDEGVAAMFLFVEPGRAEALVAARKAVAGRWRDQGLYLLSDRANALRSVRIKSAGRLAKRDDVATTMMLQARTDRHPYQELWFATDRVLGVVGVYGPGEATPSQLQAAAAGMLEALPPSDPPGRASLAPLRDWLDGVDAATPQVAATASWQYRTYLAAQDIQRGVTAPCATRFADVLAPDAVPDPVPFAQAAFRCAATRDERGTLAQAARWLDTLDPIMATYHAWTLVQERRFEQALTWLDRTAPSTEEEADAVADAQLSALLGLGRLRAAEAVLATGHGSSSVRARAAGFLFELGRRSVATGVLSEVCPTLRGEDRKLCRDNGF
ncbi:MAG: hypothetical protein KTR31_29580 [Myxococcales bacterium]|nr:hypothetical protein [Myxococcales bacterium]